MFYFKIIDVNQYCADMREKHYLSRMHCILKSMTETNKTTKIYRIYKTNNIYNTYFSK